MELNPLNVIGISLVDVETDGHLVAVTTSLTMSDLSVIPGRHVFPRDTLEWRAAEYGIDPADLDTLLDIVLHEPFMEEPDRPELTLHEAGSIKDARVYHLDRLKRVKDRRGKAKWSKPQTDQHEHNRRKLKSLVHMNPDAIAIKEELVRRERGRVRGMRVSSVPEEKTRVEQLRSLLADHTTTKGRKGNG